MGKGVELTTTKYLIHAQINANGIVEKPDVVGAVFGQTEGLLSNDLDLRELQRTGRIETAILAASLETINRVGPLKVLKNRISQITKSLLQMLIQMMILEKLQANTDALLLMADCQELEETMVQK